MRDIHFELQVTIDDDNNELITFGEGKTQLNIQLTPMPISQYPHEFTLIVPFNKTLELKKPFVFDGSREVGVMQIELPMSFHNVKKR